MVLLVLVVLVLLVLVLLVLLVLVLLRPLTLMQVLMAWVKLMLLLTAVWALRLTAPVVPVRVAEQRGVVATGKAARRSFGSGRWRRKDWKAQVALQRACEMRPCGRRGQPLPLWRLLLLLLLLVVLRRRHHCCCGYCYCCCGAPRVPVQPTTQCACSGTNALVMLSAFEWHGSALRQHEA